MKKPKRFSEGLVFEGLRVWDSSLSKTVYYDIEKA